eukprot:9232151-Lingulodinium_polyedra.AAC.1
MRSVDCPSETPQGDAALQPLPGGPNGKHVAPVEQLPQSNRRGAPRSEPGRQSREGTDQAPPTLRSGWR